MPLHEIEERFTKSELGILGWHSQERLAQMRNKTKSTREKVEQAVAPKDTKRTVADQVRDAMAKKTKAQSLGVPPELINEEGDLDLRLATGAQAYSYLNSIGMKLPVVFSDNPRPPKPKP